MRRFLLQVLRFLLRPLIRYMIRNATVDDPWEPTFFEPPPQRFGPGSLHRFSWYFEGESGVEVGNADDVFAWLESCEYASDEDIFHETDFWQHPRTFELTRRGDCEDHALWAWRKLSELGIPAEFFTGCCRDGDGSIKASGHAWVVFEEGGERYILEPAAKSRDRMIRPVAELRDRYVPAASVDSSYRTKSYQGWIAIQAARLDQG